MFLEPLDTVAPEHEPELQTPESAAERELPVPIINHGSSVTLFRSQICLHTISPLLSFSRGALMTNGRERDGRTGVMVRASVRSVRSLTKNRAGHESQQAARSRHDEDVVKEDGSQQSKPTNPHLCKLVLNESAYLLISSMRRTDRYSGKALATPAH